jgi:SagB-type dehydrogenase family enzyme
VSRTLPTAQFASIVFGPDGVALDDPAELLHEASRLYPRLAPPRLEVLAELAEGGVLARSVARSSRTHDHRPGVELPRPAHLRGRLGDLLARRRSERIEALRAVRVRELTSVLAASYGARDRSGNGKRRPVPSAGALYPLELYVIALVVEGVPAGTYHYDPFRHRLAKVGPPPFDDLRDALVDPSLAEGVAALLVVTGVFWRSRIKYGVRGYRFTLLEAGHLVQNAVLAATDLGLAALPLGGYYDRRLDAIVGADGLDEATVHALALAGAR